MFDSIRNRAFLGKNFAQFFRILHTEASKGWGGQEIRILNEAEGMRLRGHQLFILADPESELLKRANKRGFYTKAIRFQRRKFYSQVIEVKNFIETMNIDVINTHSSKDSWIALSSARLAKNKPFVIRTRHLSTPIGKNILTRLLYMHLPHVIITTGEAIRKQMVDINHFNPDKIVSIPTGVDTAFFNPDREYKDIRGELNITQSTPLVGSVSVLRSWKGLDYFVKAIPLILHEIPNARFIIAGEGPYRAKLEEAIRLTGESNKIYLLGHREDVADILSSLDILVHPSYANEGVPQTILQAMSMKKPVIATSLDSLAEIVIHGKTGIVISPENFKELAREVVRLLQNRGLAKEMGENGKRLVEIAYSFEGMIDKIESLYREFYKKKGLSKNV